MGYDAVPACVNFLIKSFDSFLQIFLHQIHLFVDFQDFFGTCVELLPPFHLLDCDSACNDIRQPFDELFDVDRATWAICNNNDAPERFVHGERANFAGLVLGCIKAKFCKSILM